MNTIITVRNIEGDDVLLVIEHIKAIYKLKDCYSVIYGDGENDFTQVVDADFCRIISHMNYVV